MSKRFEKQESQPRTLEDAVRLLAEAQVEFERISARRASLLKIVEGFGELGVFATTEVVDSTTSARPERHTRLAPKTSVRSVKRGSSKTEFDIPPGIFVNDERVVDAAEKLLRLTGKGLTSREIADALLQGGYKQTTKNLYDSVRGSLKLSIAPDGRFLRSDKLWLLPEWEQSNPHEIGEAQADGEPVTTAASPFPLTTVAQGAVQQAAMAS